MLIRYIIKRMLIAVPVLLLISFIVFMIIQLPPGSFIESKVNQMLREGTYDPEELRQLEEQYRFKDPLPVQYVHWITNFVKGDLGDSFEVGRPVTTILATVLPATMAISAFTILFTWSVAFPFGVIAAVKKNTVWDYLLTFIGLTAMATPAFIVALIFMVVMQWIDPHFDPTGLISKSLQDKPWFYWPKIVDLLKHIWIPVCILGLSGTAGMIRILRANVIDELKKQYVLCARARGLHPAVVVLRYPVRVAINPLMSSVGLVLPRIISGSMIISIVLNLPTLGPKVLAALQSQDTYMAASCIFIQCILAIIGILISDIMLSVVDPRIKFGSK
ncbi:MAG: ABC transporter permease subunit [Anaerolineaceae bacterium]|nr:ABC transporter permease subunit [Anaerolineaceae bacterium]